MRGNKLERERERAEKTSDRSKGRAFKFQFMVLFSSRWLLSVWPKQATNSNSKRVKVKAFESFQAKKVALAHNRQQQTLSLSLSLGFIHQQHQRKHSGSLSELLAGCKFIVI